MHCTGVLETSSVRPARTCPEGSANSRPRAAERLPPPRWKSVGRLNSKTSTAEGRIGKSVQVTQYSTEIGRRGRRTGVIGLPPESDQTAGCFDRLRQVGNEPNGRKTRLRRPHGRIDLPGHSFQETDRPCHPEHDLTVGKSEQSVLSQSQQLGPRGIETDPLARLTNSHETGLDGERRGSHGHRPYRSPPTSTPGRATWALGAVQPSAEPHAESCGGCSQNGIAAGRQATGGGHQRAPRSSGPGRSSSCGGSPLTRRSVVEVAGIEPASADEKPGLLRAQPAVAFLSPGAHAGEAPSRAQSLSVFPQIPRPDLTGSGPLIDAGHRAEGAPGPTDSPLASGGEFEVGARRIGTYWFATMVHEITSPSRPASPGSTYDVETCHPLCSCPTRIPRFLGPGPPARSGAVPARGDVRSGHLAGIVRVRVHVLSGPNAGSSPAAPPACPDARAGSDACRSPACPGPRPARPWRARP